MAKRGTPRETLTPKPATAKSSAELTSMPADQLAYRAAAWDDARTNLKDAADAVVAAQGVVDALATDASEADRTAALQKLEEAKGLHLFAQGVLDSLAKPADLAGTLPEGAAGSTEHGGNASAQPAPAAAELGLAEGAVRPSATNTPQSDEHGGDGNLAVPPAALARDLFPLRDTLLSSAVEQAEGVIASVRDRIADGDAEAALEHLASEIGNAELMRDVAIEIIGRLKAAHGELGRTVTVWPLEVIRYLGEERPIGKPLQMEPELADKLFAQGVVTDIDPNGVSQE